MQYLAGERDPVKLAELCHKRVRSSRDTVAKALEGDYRPEHLFALKQSLDGYRYYQQQIEEVDHEIQGQLLALPTAENAQPKLPPRTEKTPYAKKHHEPKSFNLRKELYRVFGVDLTNVPGISAVTAHTILCEVGADLSRFRNASAFASWLGLCPEKQIIGGNTLYTRTRPVRNRVAIALRLGAHALHHADNYLGEFFRRMQRKLGKPEAVTATAHKLARIVSHVLAAREEDNESFSVRTYQRSASAACARDAVGEPDLA